MKNQRTAYEIKAEINKLNAELYSLENEITCKNTKKLVEEIHNLLDGIGIIEGDYFADTRLYSSIPGVKNIRYVYNNRIDVKITDDSGYLLPEKVTIEDKEYEINIYQSSKFEHTCSY